jgi:cytochrome c peroxidase
MRSTKNALCVLALTVPFTILSCSSEAGNGTEANGSPNVPPVDARTGLRVAEHGPVPPLPDWPDNPPSLAKKALGKAIFFDPRLSGSGMATCGNCHLSVTNFQSGSPLDLPDRSYPNLAPTLPRHAPSLLNLVYAPMMRWDGSHFTDLFDMSVFPFAEGNMNLSRRLPPSDVEGIDVEGAQVALAQKLSIEIPGYAAEFQQVFGENIGTLTPPEVWRLAGKAVATYLRVAVSRDSAFDRWNAGDGAAMNDGAVRGLALFRGRAQCARCHSGPLFSDFQFHNVSTALPDEAGVRADDGRAHVTHLAEDGGKFLTPMLRTVALTSPYLHDGSETTIAKVIRRKTGAKGRSDPNHDAILEDAPDLTNAEIDDIVAFLKTLTGKPLDAMDLAGPETLPR